MKKNVSLRKLKSSDQPLFSKWWRDKELLKLTSGQLKRISDEEVEKYFSKMLKTKADRHFIINLDRKAIGHISLCKRKNSWYETQIIIGEKKYWGNGYGTQVIQSLIKKAKKLHIGKIYLEVRPNNRRAIRAYEKSGFVKKNVIKYSNNKLLPETVRMESSSEVD